MFPCCSLCYAEYLNDDGTVNEARLATARQDYRRRMPEKTKGRMSDEQIERQLAEEPCRCDCHKPNSGIMH